MDEEKNKGDKKKEDFVQEVSDMIFNHFKTNYSRQICKAYSAGYLDGWNAFDKQMRESLN